MHCIILVIVNILIFYMFCFSGTSLQCYMVYSLDVIWEKHPLQHMKIGH